VLGVERQSEQIVLGEEPAEVIRILGALVDLGRSRCHSLDRDSADRLPKVEELLR
jgi:hypothetical protein